MKKIAVIASNNFVLSENSLSLNAESKRTLKFVEYLSKEEDFKVTLLFPKKEDFNYLFENVEIDLYNSNSAYYDWSEELDTKLLKFDFVIVQTNSGIGFQNCSVLPGTINVIADGWIPTVAQLPVELLGTHKIKRKIIWSKFIDQYQNLLKRSNCLLCASDKQRYFYEGQFFMFNKLGWNAFKFSPIHKIPFGIDINKKVTLNKNEVRLLWYGDFYYSTQLMDLIAFLKDNKDIKLDIFCPKNINSKKRNKIKEIENKIKNLKNVNFINLNTSDIYEFLNKYTAGVYVPNSWIEDDYTYKYNVLELLSYGLPVITKNFINNFTEFSFIENKGLYTINEFSDLLKIGTELNLDFSQETFDNLQSSMVWSEVLTPLKNYIRMF